MIHELIIRLLIRRLESGVRDFFVASCCTRGPKAESTTQFDILLLKAARSRQLHESYLLILTVQSSSVVSNVISSWRMIVRPTTCSDLHGGMGFLLEKH